MCVARLRERYLFKHWGIVRLFPFGDFCNPVIQATSTCTSYKSRPLNQRAKRKYGNICHSKSFVNL